MDLKFLLGAMDYVGIKTVVIDEDTVMTNADNNETKVTVLSKNTYTAKKEYDCILCHKPIAVKSHYVRVLVKPDNGVVQTQRWCLPCWLG